MNHARRRSKVFLKRNAGTILSVVGSVGVVVTAVMAVQATPKALELIKAKEAEKGEKLTALERLQATGMTYAPTIVVGAATIGSILGANALNKRSQAAIMSAYALVDSTYKDYKKKVEEMYGEGANENVRAEIAKDKYTKHELNPNGETRLFYDYYSGRYFEATMADVMTAEYLINRMIVQDSCATINDWYTHLGFEPVDGGEELGWCAAANESHYWQAWVDFKHSEVVMDDGLEVCIVTIMQEPIIYYYDCC